MDNLQKLKLTVSTQHVSSCFIGSSKFQISLFPMYTEVKCDDDIFYRSQTFGLITLILQVTAMAYMRTFIYMF